MSSGDRKDLNWGPGTSYLKNSECSPDSFKNSEYLPSKKTLGTVEGTIGSYGLHEWWGKDIERDKIYY